MMADFLLLAMKEEVILEDESCQHAHQHESNENEMNIESPMCQPVKAESPESTSTALEGVDAGPYDDEMLSSTSQTACSWQEKGHEPRTEAQGAMQEKFARSQSGTEPTFPCNACRKSFSRKSHLVKHMKLHSGERPFTCDTCSQGFCYKLALQRHILTHTGERPYVCETCSKGFCEKSTLQRHILSHTGKRPYVCGTCRKGFASRAVLDCHARIHTGDKPFQCNACGRRFGRKYTLTAHIHIHTGEKAFTCETCGACFARKDKLAVHVRVHTGERPHHCETCDKRFITKSNMRRHISRGHKNLRLEVQGSCSAAGSSGQEERPEPRTSEPGPSQIHHTWHT